LPSANGKAGSHESAATASAASAEPAGELGGAETDDQDAGLTGTLESRWDWSAVAILLVPAAALLSVILIK
jgi:hypothetical protein